MQTLPPPFTALSASLATSGLLPTSLVQREKLRPGEAGCPSNLQAKDRPPCCLATLSWAHRVDEARYGKPSFNCHDSR